MEFPIPQNSAKEKDPKIIFQLDVSSILDVWRLKMVYDASDVRSGKQQILGPGLRWILKIPGSRV